MWAKNVNNWRLNEILANLIERLINIPKVGENVESGSPCLDETAAAPQLDIMGTIFSVITMRLKLIR